MSEIDWNPWIERGVLAAGALLVVWLVHATLALALRRVQASGRLSLPVASALRRVLRLLAVAAALLLVLQALGLLQSTMAALTAVMAMIAIGFVAVWSVASNILCSLIMLVAQPFQVGDEIEFLPDPIKGRVVNFNLLYTTLREPDGAVIQVPNNLFFQRMVRRRAGSAAIDLEAQLEQKEDAEV